MSNEIELTTNSEKIKRIADVNQIYAGYPLFNQILKDIEQCHYSAKNKGYDDPDCLLLIGPTGAGKTTIYRTYAQNYLCVRGGGNRPFRWPRVAVATPRRASLTTLAEETLIVHMIRTSR